jgi:carboxyl-terminal processing protease
MKGNLNMLMMKKRSLIILIVVFMLASAIGTGVLILSIGVGTGNLVVLNKAEYSKFETIMSEYSTLFDLEKFVNDNYYIPADKAAIREGTYQGVFLGLGDPYSSYMNKKDYEDLLATTAGEFQGIGVTIAPDESGFINVIAPIEDTPAARAGIMASDKIVKVDNKEYTAKTINEAVTAMRGVPGTKVKIDVLRDGKIISFDLIRSNIVLKSVKSEMLENNIGYIRITTFDEKTLGEFKNHLKDLESKNIKGLVIDLRDNPGGLVDSSVSITDMLLGSGVITFTEDRNKVREYYKSDAAKLDVPYVVLINKGSASASEIMAGAIKDNKGGKLIGETTFGKGIIQRIFSYGNDGGGIKLTVMQYFSPNGNIIHKVGVKPDIEVIIKADAYVNGDLPRENDTQLQKGIEILSK